MALSSKTKSVTPRCPNIQKKDLPPPVDPRLQLKWGLALLGKEKAAQYLIWKQYRSGEDGQ